MKTWLKAVANRIAGVGQGLSLVSSWLANALWLIETRFLPLAQKAYGQNEVLYACLSLLSRSIPEPPLAVYQKGADGQREKLDDPLHPLVRLIQRPNELMTEYEFWELTTLHMAIIGRSCWWKERDRVGNVIAHWPLRPDRVGPVYSNSDKPGERVIAGYSYQVPGVGNYIVLPRRDVLAFNFPDPAGEAGGIVEGLGPTYVLARQVAADNEATKFVGALLANYASPTIALRTKARIQSESEARLIKARFRTEFGGANQGTVAIVDADTEIDQIGFNLRELEFPDIRKIAESRIAAGLGVPPVLVGLAVGLDASTYNNVAGMRRYFAETTCATYWRRYQDQYTSDVAAEFGDDLVTEFDTSNVKALAGQRAEAIAPVAEAFGKGAVQRAEYRQALGLPVSDVDYVYLVPSNVTEVPATMEGQEVKAAVREAERLLALPCGCPQHNGKGRGHSTKRRPQGNEDDDEDAEGDGIAALKVSPDPHDAAERRMLEALQGSMSDLAQQVARKIEQGLPVTDAELSESFGSIIEVQLVEIVEGQIGLLSGELGFAVDSAVVNAAAREWSKTYTYDLVKGLNETTRELLQTVVTQYTETPGMTIGQLRGLLESAFGQVRATMISVTEVTRAYSEATNQYQRALSEAGITMTRIWLTDNDDLVCPICAPRHKQPETKWKAASPSGPPAHVGCRCDTSLKSVEATE